MKWLTTRNFAVLGALVPLSLNAQIFTSESSTLFISPGGVLHCNGGMTLANASLFTNNGLLKITKNSAFPLPGTISINSTSIVNGNGDYYVEQDWINNADFQANGSAVYLYGNTEQFITSTNGTVTEFNDLVLQGSGFANDRKKTLNGVDARISISGTLAINDRELATQTNEFSVLNSAPGCISNSLVFGSEGFVSSLPPGYLSWSTSSSSSYYYPVGSSEGTLRYRPVEIQPMNSAANIYKVRLNNTIGDTYGYMLAQHDDQISAANTNFFHSIERSAGSTDADIRIAYDADVDGDWSGIAKWTLSQLQWNTIGADDNSGLGNYNALQKASWDFQDPFHPYILVNLNQQLIIPNVFTPNEDGSNDLYYVTGNGITEFNMVIVNRWGEVVFEANDINSAWDGKVRGEKCSEGTYFYIIRAKSPTQEYNKQGHITLYSK